LVDLILRRTSLREKAQVKAKAATKAKVKVKEDFEKLYFMVFESQG
jgi:hypothetical protein